MKLQLSSSGKRTIADLIAGVDDLSSIVQRHDQASYKGPIWAKERRELSFLSDIDRAIKRKHKTKPEREKEFLEVLNKLSDGTWTQQVELVKLAIGYGVVYITAAEARDLSYLNR